jgi:hypothetical protein
MPIYDGDERTYDQTGKELTAGSRTFTYDLANRVKTTAGEYDDLSSSRPFQLQYGTSRFFFVRSDALHLIVTDKGLGEAQESSTEQSNGDA